MDAPLCAFGDEEILGVRREADQTVRVLALSLVRPRWAHRQADTADGVLYAHSFQQ